MTPVTISLVEIFIAFAMAATTVWASNHALKRMTRKAGSPPESDADPAGLSSAEAIVFGAISLGATLIAVQATQAIGTTFNALGDDLATAIPYTIGFAAIAVAIALLAVGVATKLTMAFTPHDESRDIANNNIGTAVALAPNAAVQSASESASAGSAALSSSVSGSTPIG